MKWVVDQLGYGAESVRTWVKQAEIVDGSAPGVSTDEAKGPKELERDAPGLRRANEILKRAASFLEAEPGRQHKRIVAIIDAYKDDIVGGRRLEVEPICKVLHMAPRTCYAAK